MREHQAKLQMVFALFIFGTIGILVYYIKLPTNLIAVTRGFLGSAFLIIMAKVRKEKISMKSIKNNWKFLCLSGVFIGLNWIFLFEAFKYTTVAIATLCCYLAPIFIMMASPFILKEKLSTINIVCISIALLGMIFISGIFETSGIKNDNFKGIAFGVASAICYACVIFINKSIKRISANNMTIVQLAVAGLAFLPYTLLYKNSQTIKFDFVSVFLLIILSVFHTGFAYALYFKAAKHLKTQTLAIYSYIDPIVAIILSTIILRQKMSFLNIIGAILILSSTMFSEIYEHKKVK